MPRHPILLLLLALVAPACRRAAPPPEVAPPPSLGLDAAGTYRAYLEARPARFKMRHQVASSFAGRDEVIEGFLVLERPDRFYVSARSPMGPALFDVKAVPPAALEVKAHLPQLSDERMARYLARDIRRIYLTDCPEGSTLEAAEGGGVVARGAVAAADDAIPGDDGPDDALAVRVDANGLVREKTYSRAGRPTVVIRYDEQRPVGGTWLAHRIGLVHQQLPYRLTIVLLAADLGFDTSRIFAGSPR